MDWILFWTAVAAVAAVVTILGLLFGYLRKQDLSLFQQFKEYMSDKVTKLEEKDEHVIANLQSKLDKVDFERYVDKTDQELTNLRQDIKDGNSALSTKIDNMNRDLSNKIETQFDRIVQLINKQ